SCRRSVRSPLFPYTTLFRSVESIQHIMKINCIFLDNFHRFQLFQFRLSDKTIVFDISIIGQMPCIGDISNVSNIVSEMKMSKTRSEEHTSELQSRENLVCRL